MAILTDMGKRMSIRLIQEAVNDHLSRLTPAQVEGIVAEYPDDDTAKQIVEAAYLFTNDRNVETAKKMLYNSAKFLLDEGDYPR
jgi:hypothetical protein